MATLEQTLAAVLQQIEKARAAGDDRALAGLLQRKDAICALLCALDQH